MVTIKDIAKKAGVAVSTVSYVLNNTKNVKPHTKQKILQAIEELQYIPNQAARSLKTKKSATIGVMVSDMTNMFFIGVVRGIEDHLYRHGYSVILCNTDENPEKEQKFRTTMLEKDIDGLIFVGTGQQLTETRLDLPLVSVDRKAGDVPYSVVLDNRLGGYLACRHLLEKRTRMAGSTDSVCLLTGPLHINTYYDRLQGYLTALGESGITADPAWIQECEVSLEGGAAGTERLLAGMQLQAPTAIFASNDLIALGAMRTLIRRGIRIPEDTAIVGFDDIPTAALVTPALTTIEQPKYEMGLQAAELLLAQLNPAMAEALDASRSIMLEPKLIVRDTT